jgi:phospho-N-acetylmuramoyl-pentapeptide-transferase
MLQFIVLFLISIAYFIFAKKFLIKFTQPQRTFTPNSTEKTKTKPIPCGGLLFYVTFVIFGIIGKLPFEQILLVSVFFVIGALDDIGKIWNKSHISFLNGKWKLAIQLLSCGVFAFFITQNGYTFNIYKHSFNVPLFFAIPLIAFIISGTANAVNLTDGQDALASRVSLIVLLFLATLGFVNLPIITVILAFLIFNSKPASIYMGDSGSLTIGAIIATQFIQGKIEWLLPIVGVVFVAEALSVILQVAYFKATQGKRIFKMSPIHHHFELSGFSEEKISNTAFVITCVTSFCALLILQNVS